MGHSGIIDTNINVPLTITSDATDALYYKVWGFKGETTKTQTADGTSTDFTFTDKPAATDISSVKIGSVEQTLTTDYTYDASTGTISFVTAPADESVISITYTKDVLLESDVPRQSFTKPTTSINVNFPETTGNVTVSARLWDDVENQSNVGSITVYCDLTNPVVSITSITANGLTPPKISCISGKDVATIIWEASEIYTEYKVCVVSAENAAQNAGVVIPSTAGSTNVSGTGTFPAGTSVTTTIKGADLATASSGDGTKIIKIFVKDQSDHWSV